MIYTWTIHFIMYISVFITSFVCFSAGRVVVSSKLKLGRPEAEKIPVRSVLWPLTTVVKSHLIWIHFVLVLRISLCVEKGLEPQNTDLPHNRLAIQYCNRTNDVILPWTILCPELFLIFFGWIVEYFSWLVLITYQYLLT